MARMRYSPFFLLLAFCIALGTAHAAEERAQIEIPIPAREAVLLKFKAFDPSRVLIEEQAVLRELLKVMEKQSQWPLSVRGSLVKHLEGLRTKVDAPQSRIGFEYISLDRYDSGSEYGQSLSIPVSYELNRTGQDFAIRLIPAAAGELVTRSSRGIFRVSTPQLNPPEALLADFSSILSSLPRLAVNRQCIVKGEKTSTYKPEAIIGNFERLLGRHGGASNEARASGLDRPEVFAYLAGQVRVPLSITAVAYRDGTRIIYSASLPYTLRPDGTGEGYDLPEKLSADIDRILAD